MKKLMTASILAAATVLTCTADNPKANDNATVTQGNARFTVLTPEMIRIEYSPSGQFEDRATFSVINRELPVPKFSKTDDGEFLTITTDALSLRYRKGSNPMTNPASPENLTVVLPVNVDHHHLDPAGQYGCLPWPGIRILCMCTILSFPSHSSQTRT